MAGYAGLRPRVCGAVERKTGLSGSLGPLAALKLE